MLQNMIENENCRLTHCIQTWDFLYITDAIESIVALIEIPCQNGIYNVGSGISLPSKEFVLEMYRIANSRSIPYPQSGMVSIEPVVSKLKYQTGWCPKVSFSEGINMIIKSLVL